MTRRYLVYVEADSEQDAQRTLNELLSLPRQIVQPERPVTIGMVDVTDKIVNQEAISSA